MKEKTFSTAVFVSFTAILLGIVGIFLNIHQLIWLALVLVIIAGVMMLSTRIEIR